MEKMCPICGRYDCEWSAGPFCERTSPAAPKGYRIRAGIQNFGGFFFYAERRKRKWFSIKWEQITGVFGYTPEETLTSLYGKIDAESAAALARYPLTR